MTCKEFVCYLKPKNKIEFATRLKQKIYTFKVYEFDMDCVSYAIPTTPILGLGLAIEFAHKPVRADDWINLEENIIFSGRLVEIQSSHNGKQYTNVENAISLHVKKNTSNDMRKDLVFCRYFENDEKGERGSYLRKINDISNPKSSTDWIYKSRNAFETYFISFRSNFQDILKDMEKKATTTLLQPTTIIKKKLAVKQ